MSQRKKSKRRLKTKIVRLTPKEVKFIEALRHGKNRRNAALAAGYSPKNPDQSAHQVIRNIERKGGPNVYEALGMTRDTFIQTHLAPALEAKETKFFAHNGKIVSKRDVVNWTARQRAQDMVFLIAGEYKTEQENIAPGIKVVVINAGNRPERPTIAVTIPTIPGLPAPKEP